MFPKTGGLDTLKVSMGGKAFLEELVGKDARLGEGHTALRISKYMCPSRTLLFNGYCLTIQGVKRAKGMHMYLYQSRGAER